MPSRSSQLLVQRLAHPGNVELLQRQWGFVGVDEFSRQMPMLMAVVRIDLVGLQALAHLAVDPEFVTVG